MGKYITVTDNLKKYAKFQYDLFNKKTGFKIEMPYDELLAFIAQTADKYENIHKNNLNEDNLCDEIDNAVAKSAPTMINNAFKESTRSFNDEEFTQIMEAFMETMANINVAYKMEKDLSPSLNIKSSFSGITGEEYSKIYSSATGKPKNSYEVYNKKYSTVKKNHSQTLVSDLKEKTDACRMGNEKDLREVAAVYTRLKEKQKANSWFTNWFTKKGYQERAALKECEKQLKQKYGLEVHGTFITFDKKMEQYAYQNNEIITDFENSMMRVAYSKNNDYNIHVQDFRKYNSNENKDEYINDKLEYCPQLVVNDGDKINAFEAEEINTNIDNGVINTEDTELEKEIEI